MPSSFARFPNLLTPEYFYEYSEPHRRRPTIFEVPALSIHTATYFSLDGPAPLDGAVHGDEERFREFLSRFRGWFTWTRRPYGDDPKVHSQIDERFLDTFAAYLRPRVTDHGEDRDQVLAFECTDYIGSPLAVRVEVHKEYFSVTLFYQIKIIRQDARTLIRAGALSPFIPEQTIVCDFNEGDSGVLDQVFGAVHHRLLAHVNSPSVALYATIEGLFPHCTFANFHGCTVPVVAFGEADSPDFCAPWDGVIDEADYARTQSFLAKMWPQLQRTIYGQSDDVIANYVQDGHALYVSSLGSQTSPRDVDDLRYVVFFEDDQHMPAPPGDLTQDEVWRQRNWRMSRLIYRLHEAGTLRLAGLRKLRQLRQGMNDLTQIEHQVVRKAWPSYIGFSFAHEVRKATERLFKLGASLGEPIQNRLSRSAYYFARSQAQVAALGVVKIPGWQSYKEFLERRLYNTYSQIGAMGPRIDRLLRFIQAQNDALQSRRSALWQIVGAIAALLGLPYIFADIYQKYAGTDHAWRDGFNLGFSLLLGAFLLSLAWWGFRSIRRTRKRAEAIQRRRADARRLRG